MAKIKAVIYDMDGILIDSEPLWREAEIKSFAKVGIRVTEEMCKLTMGMRTREIVDYRYSRTPWSGMTREDVVSDLVDEVIRLIREQGKPLPGVKSSLEYFRSQGLKIALATSSSQRLIDVILDKLQVGNYFEVINSAEHLEYGKPHPEIFLKTSKDLNVNPFDCLVIEDSFNGVLAAKAARMKVVAIPDSEGQKDPRFIIADYRLKSLTEIETIDIE